MSDVVNVTKRDTQGTRAMRRLRANGIIPAVLYGHGEENLNLAVTRAEMNPVLRHGGRLVELRGAVTEKALIRDMQWDVFGTHILHIDFTRVSEHEKVHVTVSVELRGEAAGVKEGGVVEQPIHEVEVECPASAIPDKIVVKIGDLGLNKSLTIADIPLPDQVRILDDAELVVVTCHVPVEAPEATGVEGTGAEPEVIGRAAKEEEGEGE